MDNIWKKALNLLYNEVDFKGAASLIENQIGWKFDGFRGLINYHQMNLKTAVSQLSESIKNSTVEEDDDEYRLAFFRVKLYMTLQFESLKTGNISALDHVIKESKSDSRIKSTESKELIESLIIIESFRKGDLTVVRELCENTLDYTSKISIAKPTNIDTYITLAALSHIEGKYSEALEFYKLAKIAISFVDTKLQRGLFSSRLAAFTEHWGMESESIEWFFTIEELECPESSKEALHNRRVAIFEAIRRNVSIIL